MNHSERQAYLQGARHMCESFGAKLTSIPIGPESILHHERVAIESLQEAHAYLHELRRWIARNDPDEHPPHPRVKRMPV